MKNLTIEQVERIEQIDSEFREALMNYHYNRITFNELVKIQSKHTEEKLSMGLDLQDIVVLIQNKTDYYPSNKN